MKARAPGKLVLSGAYSVLHGAPAIVTAVDRYVVADTAAKPELLTPEVAAALGKKGAPGFDASALRHDGKKLGLGSSAAILVASLAACELEAAGPLLPGDLVSRVAGRAIEAHQAGQGGGSGVDVIASLLGGTFSFEGTASDPNVRFVELPPGLSIEAWWSGAASSTSELLERVRKLSEKARPEHDRLMRAQADAAERALAAVDRGDRKGFIDALDAQRAALAALGAAAGASIVTEATEALARLAKEEGATVVPAGAGGGDVILFAGSAPSSSAFRAEAERRAHRLLELALGAPGVHAVEVETPS